MKEEFLDWMELPVTIKFYEFLGNVKVGINDSILEQVLNFNKDELARLVGRRDMIEDILDVVFEDDITSEGKNG